MRLLNLHEGINNVTWEKREQTKSDRRPKARGEGENDVQMGIGKLTAEAQRAQSKAIVDRNELGERALSTAIAVLSIKRGATVAFYFLKP